jgi:phosphoglycolate phosphatase
MIHNFIFDLDGTLVDSLPGIALAIAAALPEGSAPGSDLRSLIGPPIREILKSLSGCTDKTELDVIEARFRYAYDSAGWRESVAYPGIPELLQQLSETDRQLFVVTNKPLKPATGILTMLNLLKHFEDIVTPDSASPPYRSKAEMLQALMTLWQLDAADALFIGDSMEDYLAATSADVQFAVVAWGYGVQRIAIEAPGQRVFTEAYQIFEAFPANGAAMGASL